MAVAVPWADCATAVGRGGRNRLGRGRGPGLFRCSRPGQYLRIGRSRGRQRLLSGPGRCNRGLPGLILAHGRRW